MDRILIFLVLAALLLLSACTRHHVTADTTHKVEIAPIYVTVDINLKVQRALDDALAFQGSWRMFLLKKNSGSSNNQEQDIREIKMKKANRLFILFWILLFVSAGMAAWAQDRDKQDVVQSMKDRHAELIQAKDQGLVGEAWNGLAGIVDENAPAEIRELVNAENSDRRVLFQIIARETDTSVQEVALQNRIRMYRLAAADHFVQDKDRNWVRKKDLQP